jgi:hypothetical protein
MTTNHVVNSWNVAANSAAMLHFSGHNVLKLGEVYQLTYTQTAGQFSDQKNIQA